MVVIFMLALLIASWAPRIPQIRDELDFSEGELGLALLGGPVGGLSLLPVAGLLVRRRGSRTMVRISLVGYSVAGLGLVLTTGVPSLFAVLAVWCGLARILDLAVNAQAAMVEERFGRRIMMTVHAAWTGGALVGAGLGTAAAALDIPFGTQFLILGAISLGAGLPSSHWMLGGDGVAVVAQEPGSVPVPPQPRGEPGSGGAPRRSRRRSVRRRVPPGAAPFIPLCMVTFASYLGEGIAADWSAVYLTDVTGASAGTAGIALVAFMSCMFGVRLVGDRVVEAYGVRRTIRPLALLAAAVFTVALTFGETAAGTALGVLGFALLGVGLGCVVPSAFSAAGQLAARTGVSAGPVLAFVGSAGYAGWLLGPPLIGGLAEHAGLRSTLWVVVALALAIASLSGLLAGESARAGSAGAKERRAGEAELAGDG